MKCPVSKAYKKMGEKPSGMKKPKAKPKGKRWDSYRDNKKV